MATGLFIGSSSRQTVAGFVKGDSTMNDAPAIQNKSVSWFKAMRNPETLELIRANPNAFVLAYIIGYRARYREGFNADGLEQGEAMLGDFRSYGMSERQYRTAKEQLTKWRFATFKTTNKGTLGKLIDTRLFDPLNITADGQNDSQPTGKRRTADGQPTTNKKGVIKHNNELESGKNVGRSAVAEPAAKVAISEDWISELSKDAAYTGIDIHREHSKMNRWCIEHHKQPTRRRFVNWLNRADRPLPQAQVVQVSTSQPPTFKTGKLQLT